MYESPIDFIYDEIQTQLEQEVLKAIQKVGIIVDKEELIKALAYDRGSYENGYLSGLRVADEKIIRCKDCRYFELEGESAYGFCTNNETVWRKNGFCSNAERKI